jgi:transposase-like protein
VIATTQNALEAFLARRWDGINFVAIMIDGVHVGQAHVVAALGIDKSGRKHILGWQLGSTEHEVVCRDLIRPLIEAGLNVDGDYLFILDGSKSLRKAVKLVFGDRSVVQRCQEHKIRDVEGYLPRKLRNRYRMKIQAAYNETSYRQASSRLQKLRLELLSISEQAANSLTEGLEDTLTLHKLGISGGVRQSLRTTNSIESAFARLRKYTHNVSHWSDSQQVERWLAFFLPQIESGFQRLPGFRQLAKLQRAVKQQLTASQSPSS